MGSKKYIIYSTLILMVIGIIIISGCVKRKVEEEQPLPEEISSPTEGTGDWETYTNEEYGYEIKYLEDWELKESETKDMAVFESPTSRERPPAEPYPEAYSSSYAFDLLAGSNERDLQTLEEYVAQKKETNIAFLEGNIEYTSEESYTVNGKTGIKLAGEYSPAGRDDIKFVEFVYLSLDKGWEVHCEAVKDKFDDYADTCNQIIESLEITEPEETEEETGWQTYTSDKYGYEIKYPKDWYFLESNPEEMIGLNNCSSKPADLRIDCDQIYISVGTGTWNSVDDVEEVKILKEQAPISEGLSYEYTTLSDLKAVKFNKSGAPSYYVVKGNYSYKIDVTPNCTDCGQIVTSFKFLE